MIELLPSPSFLFAGGAPKEDDMKGRERKGKLVSFFEFHMISSFAAALLAQGNI